MIRLFKKINKNIQRIIVGLVVLCSTSILFPAGMISTSSQIEVCSDFFTTLTKSHTKGKEYSALVVEAKDGSSKKLTDTQREFYDLYGSFRTDKACFANSVNINKTKNIKLGSTSIENLSLLITTTGIQVQYIKGVGLRHEFYPLNMMLEAPKSERPSPPSQYCFISQSQADALLRSDFLGEPVAEPFTLEDYKKLQYKMINLTCDESTVSYYILSIYLETGYYYQALKEIMGDFVFVYGPTPAQLKREAVYFMRDYTFQNQHYIEYAKKQYDISDFDYKIGTFNLIDNFAQKEDITRLLFPLYSDAPSILLFVLSVLLMLTIMVFTCLTSFGNKWLDIVVFSGCAITPYIIFKLIAKLTESIKLFTSLSTQFNMVMLIVVFIFFAVVVLLKNAKRKEIKK